MLSTGPNPPHKKSAPRPHLEAIIILSTLLTQPSRGENGPTLGETRESVMALLFVFSHSSCLILRDLSETSSIVIMGAIKVGGLWGGRPTKCCGFFSSRTQTALATCSPFVSAYSLWQASASWQTASRMDVAPWYYRWDWSGMVNGYLWVVVCGT